MRLLPILLMLMCAPIIADASNDKILLKELPNSDGRKKGSTFSATMKIKATVNEVYQLLTAFQDYPKFMPNTNKVEVLQRTENTAVTNTTLELPMAKVKKYRLRMTYSHDQQSAIIKWKLIEWPGLKASETIADTVGYWQLTQEGDDVIVLYHVYTDPGSVPFGFGWIVDLLSKNSLPDLLYNTRAQVYKQR